MAEETTSRKTFRLDDDVAKLLQERKEKGSYGSTENDVVNRLLRNIPLQEKKILESHAAYNKQNELLIQTQRNLKETEAELNKLTNALLLLGSYLNPLGK